MLIRNAESKDCKVKLLMFAIGINKLRMDISVSTGKVLLAVTIKLDPLKEHIIGKPPAEHETLPKLLN